MFLNFASPTPLPVDAANGGGLEAIATIIQAVATVVALIGVAITFIYAARSEKRDREKAQDESRRAVEQNRLAREEAERSQASAERAENAAALSIDTMARIADAVEALSKKDFAASALPVAVPQRVRWSLEHFQGATYILKNIGNATAFDVQITADPTLMTAGELPVRRDFRPDDVETFMAAASLGTRDKTITVGWSNTADGTERDVWRYPLPARPPKGV